MKVGERAEYKGEMPQTGGSGTVAQLTRRGTAACNTASRRKENVAYRMREKRFNGQARVSVVDLRFASHICRQCRGLFLGNKGRLSAL